MRSETTPRARRYWAALIFLLLGVLLGAWHNRVTTRGRQDPVVGGVRGVLAPPVGAMGSVSHWFGRQTGWLFRGHAADAENRSLKDRVAQLEGENAALREAQTNLDRLRGDLGFVKANTPRLLAADITARKSDPKFDTLIINRGSRDGVRINSMVRTRNGLVGRVFEVTPGTASVLMLTDQKSGVGGRVQRAASRAVGVCEGNNSPRLELKYLPGDADIKVGDLIVTSGLGGIFPSGQVIGTVEKIKPDENNVGKTAVVHPVVEFDRLEEVYVQP
jgi:rod shape-determining protein MreC